MRHHTSPRTLSWSLLMPLLIACGRSGADQSPPPPAAEAEPAAVAQPEPEAEPSTGAAALAPKPPPSPELEAALDAAEQALRAELASVKPHRSARGAHDCGEDVACFIDKGAACEHARFRQIHRTLGAISIIDYVVGGPKRGDRCYFRQDVRATRYVQSERVEKLAQRMGKSEEEMLAHMNRDLATRQDQSLSCFYPQPRHDEVVAGLAGGRMRPRAQDWEFCHAGDGECVSTALAEGCKAGACKDGRFPITCERGGATHRCTSPPKGEAELAPHCKLDCDERGKQVVTCKG